MAMEAFGMRGKHGGYRAAIWAYALLLWMGMGRTALAAGQLTIEVIAPAAQAVAAQSAMEESAPTVLIYHTHTWEAYEMEEGARYTPTETWRTEDNAHNMVRIGQELARELTALGFAVTHDTTAFEPPTLSSAYTRSLAMLRSRLDAGETYDYILDIHRDAFSGLRNGANAVTADGEEIAYVMLLVGKGTGETGSGFDERPDWPQNLALAQEITDAMNAHTPGVAKEVRIKSGRFNQHVSTGALLIEVGNNKNTLREALAACPVIARAIAAAHGATHTSAYATAPPSPAATPAPD